MLHSLKLVELVCYVESSPWVDTFDGHVTAVLVSPLRLPVDEKDVERALLKVNSIVHRYEFEADQAVEHRVEGFVVCLENILVQRWHETDHSLLELEIDEPPGAHSEKEPEENETELVKGQSEELEH